jgi:hypothetical protein
MKILTRLPYILCLVLLAYMPFHIFISQSVSLATGGLEAWKIGKDVLLAAGVLFTICLVWWQGRGDKIFNGLVIFAVLYGLLHLILWGVGPDSDNRSAMIGIIYNMRLVLFLILGYGAYRLYKFAFSTVIRFILLVSTIVAGLGVLQYFLPSDLLTHAGYSIDRGARPAFFIEDHPDLPRIMSTLREPNALGAYLILPAAFIAALFLRVRDRNKRLLLGGALGLHLLAIFLTFSRSAWLAVCLAVGLVVWWRYYRTVLLYVRRWWPVAVGLVVVAAIGIFSVRNTAVFQQYIIHSNPNEQVDDLDSNDLHVQLVKEGLQGIADEPLGHGPGTAGLASIHNPQGQLTENYYVQVGYEVGILGMAMFIALNIWLYMKIRGSSDYSLALCAGFWAYVLTNMLLHTWGNEAVAAQWWILTGMFLVYAGFQRKHQGSVTE